MVNLPETPHDMDNTASDKFVMVVVQFRRSSEVDVHRNSKNRPKFMSRHAEETGPLHYILARQDS